jgi:hypothetical protein
VANGNIIRPYPPYSPYGKITGVGRYLQNGMKHQVNEAYVFG